MLKNQDIICISSIDWDFIWQGHQEIMATFAAHGNRVLFIENTGVRAPREIKDVQRIFKRLKNWFQSTNGFRKERENLYVFSPIVLPFPYSSIARSLNKTLLLFLIKRWQKAMNFHSPVIWTFLPTALVLEIVNNIHHKAFIYYCIDSFIDSSAGAKKIQQTERKVMSLADAVFVTSHKLMDYAKENNNNVGFFPFGVSLEKFEKTRDSETNIPEDLQSIPKPIIGYIGGLHQWVDFTLIKEVAEHNKDKSFVLVGPEQVDVSEVKGVDNIYLLGKKEHDLLPLYIKNFDCCLIPYRIAPYTDNVYPTKLNEYLSMGKGIVSTNLKEVRYFKEENDVVEIAETAGEFSDGIRKILDKNNKTIQQHRIEASKDNSWTVKIGKMSEIITKIVHEKRARSESEWTDHFVKGLSRTRKKVAVTFATLLFIYGFIFYTPVVWKLAEPLKIVESPVKSDAIVVFGGGVGESGKSGINYAYRVTKAVKLYKAGYSQKIIFSVGDVSEIKETDLMKVLAINLGVKPEDILIEDRSGSTFENVAFTNAILKEEGYKTILLVTSLYHGLRALKTFNSNFPETNVFITPVENSPFYAEGRNPQG
ncbi:MAG: YdcF family protein, partial [Nitrospinae bacterium]|nr:YdcF family protein [Nitrospinota bacterium]